LIREAPVSSPDVSSPDVSSTDVSSPERTRRSARNRGWFAVGVALLVHAALLGAMGLIRPQLVTPKLDNAGAIELQLLPPLDTVQARLAGATPRLARLSLAAPSPLAGFAAPPIAPTATVAAAAPATATATATSRPAAAAVAQAAPTDFPGFFNGQLPGCGPEDLALLTGEEKVRCRNQIEAARVRQLQAQADADRAARVAAMRQAPRIDGIAPEKRAAYDAAVAAAKAVREDFSMKALQAVKANRQTMRDDHIDVNVSAHCSMSFGVNMGKPALHCPLAPPTGFLTEEARVTPP
jgi:hypothetical protein